jgi:DNA-binding CsgD family transcriptional regulator
MGLLVRSRAQICHGSEADRCYVDALVRISRTSVRLELARTQLVYGEWLRREGRRTEARQQLRSCYDFFSSRGVEAFADRAYRELLAAGESAMRRDGGTGPELTPQEEHIAHLARDGRTNAEIGGELFISARTVEWHLGKVFAKLGITSRQELQTALPSSQRAAR